jgi:hypothetical protein
MQLILRKQFLLERRRNQISNYFRAIIFVVCIGTLFVEICYYFFAFYLENYMLLLQYILECLDL